MKSLLNLVLVLAVLTASASNSAAADEADNKRIAVRFVESIGNRSHQNHLAADYTQLRGEFHVLANNAAGSELAEQAQPLSEVFEFRTTRIEDMVAEGDLVGVRYRIDARHIGNLHGVAATGKSFDIDAAAILTIDDDKVSKAWMMADEAGLLRQVGAQLPARADGRTVVPEHVMHGRPGDDVFAELQANPIDTQAYRNKLLVAAYKSKNPPAGMIPPRPARPYEKATRSGFFHLSERGRELGMAEKHPFGGAFPDRLDKIALLLSEGDTVMIVFELTGTNSNSLFGIPPTNAPVSAWEVGFMTFEDDYWKYGWWFGDDLSMSLQLQAPPEFLVPAVTDAAD